MSLVSPSHHVRLARPSRSLAAAERFWVSGVGLDVLWRTESVDPGEHELLMVGAPGGAWHIELVADQAALAANPPGPEDLLVIYRGEPVAEEDLRRLTAAGGRRVPSRNPYWDTHGVTIQDPDGHLVVLSHRMWGAS